MTIKQVNQLIRIAFLNPFNYLKSDGSFNIRNVNRDEKAGLITVSRDDNGNIAKIDIPKKTTAIDQLMKAFS